MNIIRKSGTDRSVHLVAQSNANERVQKFTSLNVSDEKTSRRKSKRKLFPIRTVQPMFRMRAEKKFEREWFCDHRRRCSRHKRMNFERSLIVQRARKKFEKESVTNVLSQVYIKMRNIRNTDARKKRSERRRRKRSTGQT